MKKIAMFALIMILCSAFAMAACPEGMVSYWTFNNSANVGKDNYDGHDGNNSGAVWTSSGISGGALQFNGLDNYVEIPDSTDWDFGINNFTIEFWFKTSVTGQHQMILYQGDPYGGPEFISPFFIIIRPDNALHFSPDYFAYPAQHDIISNQTVTDGLWHYGVVKRESAYFRMYIDGNETGTPLNLGESFSAQSSTYPITIGTLGPPANFVPFNGLVDEIAIYNRTLINTEITQHYNDGVLGKGYCELSNQNESVPEVDGNPKFLTFLLIVAVIAVVGVILFKKE